MNNNNTISLQDLQNHSVAPPSFLFENIQNKIVEEDKLFSIKLQSLLNHTIQPPTATVSFGEIMSRIKDTDELNIFKPLKKYEVATPFTFAAIMEKIRAIMGTTNNVIPIKSTKVFSISTKLKKLVAAAAVLLLCFVSYFTYKNTNTPQVNNLPSLTSTTIATIPSLSLLNNDAQKAVDSNIVITNPTIVDVFNNINSATIYKNRRDFRKENKQRMVVAIPMQEIPVATEMNIAGTKMPIIDNDYLASFAALNENNLPAFLQVEKPLATTITIDDYTYITISEGMGAMMKKMYKTRKSGKPTRRARKTKEKLEKWRKADAEYFNQNSTTNPLDPIDLGNFIFNK